ncbi:hypothetical protein QFF56_03035 [Ligilactobacillus animalis]|uniref:Uncharacterized protein n=1 Tax=Ligilactobacillus animalis TaxID=1605 RepID=A0AAJ6FPB9_9LACO|nr:hypothetical protein [Ligilactobacillus animalis]WHQ80674.1 hypothetical protein QFF56_03035 [Ligilactobacillus animalis]
MAISLNTIVTGMNGGPEAIMQNFNNVKNELERMNGSVTVIPKEQFTALNGITIDNNNRSCQIYKFNNFAIITMGVFVGGVTMKGWTSKDVLTIPKSYLNGFSKFQYFGDKKQLTDDKQLYDAVFDISKGSLGIYNRGADFSNKGLELIFVGILYN